MLLGQIVQALQPVDLKIRITRLVAIGLGKLKTQFAGLALVGWCPGKQNQSKQESKRMSGEKVEGQLRGTSVLFSCVHATL